LTTVATLFDYNGVLVDDEHVHLEGFRRVLAPLGIEVSEREYLERYIGYDDVGAFRTMLEDAGFAPDVERVRALVAQKTPIYRELAKTELRAFAGAAALVERRAALGPVGIVSGALRDEIAMGLELLGIADYVSVIVGAEDMSAPKPDPAGYLAGIEALARFVDRESAERALVIEDSLAGIQAAKAARLACVAVAHSYPLEQLEGAGADLVVRELDELDDERLGALHRRLYG
jgi:HAD superfamily hydrolase (TIGR01509 family)